MRKRVLLRLVVVALAGNWVGGDIYGMLQRLGAISPPGASR
jgi:hypothetical protein